MLNFDTKPFIDSALQLIDHDEVELALKVLNSLPGYYRDNIPEEIKALKNKISARIFTPQDYAENPADLPRPNENNLDFLNGTARGLLLKNAVVEANKEGITPHLVDYGPGDYGLPLALQASHLKFHYTPVGLDNNALVEAKRRLGPIWVDDYKNSESKNIWFIAYEIIEHLHEPKEIRQIFDKINSKVERVFLSTPKYTYDNGNLDWMNRGLPHLRTYTPREMYEFCLDNFTEFKWTYYDNPVMCYVGALP